MRVQDIIRSMVDMIDHMQSNKPEVTPTVVVSHPTATIVPVGDAPGESSPLTHAGDDINRWKQIVDLASTDDCSPIGNTPDPKIASIDSVTIDAGGGMNGPKDPSDLRGEHVSLYPNHQHGVR